MARRMCFCVASCFISQLHLELQPCLSGGGPHQTTSTGLGAQETTTTTTIIITPLSLIPLSLGSLNSGLMLMVGTLAVPRSGHYEFLESGLSWLNEG
ncbi:hypothetical protein I7I48_05143 [Histoplasma ohiense]|nr:hypothetical protein I7I48_05143 [Histoplasma ohiense (nom. inval.)]